MGSQDKIINVIDFGSAKISTLIASYNPDVKKLNVIGLSTVPSRGFKRGQIVDIEGAIASLNQSIEGAERMAGTNVGSAYVSVGSVNLISKNSRGVVAVSDPNNEIVESDIERVIDAAKAVQLPPSYEAIHVIPRDFIVDGQTGMRDARGMMGIRLEVETHIVIESLPNIRNILKTLKELGIELESFVFAGFASSLAVLTETEMDLGVILLDIGAGKTDMAVWIDGALSHSCVLPVGAGHVTKDLALGLRVSLESAEKIKIFVSDKYSAMDEETRKKEQYKDEIDLSTLNLPENVYRTSKKTLIEGIIKPRLTEIFALAGQELEKSGFLNATPAGVVLTGGGSLSVNAAMICRHKMVMPVRVGVPEGVGGLADEVSDPLHATSVGLLKFAISQAMKDKKKFASFDFIKNLSGKSFFTKIGKLLKNLLP